MQAIEEQTDEQVEEGQGARKRMILLMTNAARKPIVFKQRKVTV